LDCYEAIALAITSPVLSGQLSFKLNTIISHESRDSRQLKV